MTEKTAARTLSNSANDRIPVPKRRPYNPQHDYTIRVGEYPIRFKNFLTFMNYLTPPASHLVISAHDPAGTLLWEMNGLPTSPDGKTSNAAGALFDSNDRIKVHTDDGPHGRFARDTVNQRVVLWGSKPDIEAYKRRLTSVGRRINEQDLPYRLLDQNSNASAGTQLSEVGVDRKTILRNNGLIGNAPGFGQHLLPRPNKKVKRQPTYDHNNR